MAASTFELEIATPERLLLRETVSEAQVPARDGYLGILPDHAPLISEMGVGELTYRTGVGLRDLVVSGGWVEVLNNRVRVLAVTAETPDEIDSARARQALDRARERLDKPFEGMDVGRAVNAMKRAQARLAVAKH